MERLKKRIKDKWIKLTDRSDYKILRYWNGLCPLCDEHIGINIMVKPVAGITTAKCPVCGEEIYELIREMEKVDS